jgi:hypothetical protein
VYSILGENNPGLAGRTHMTVMTCPRVLREGTRKTVFVNFMDTCQKCVFALLELCTLPVDGVYIIN